MRNDGTGQKENIEGWTKEGKPLERIMQASQLVQIQLDIKKDETGINKGLTEAMQEMANLQTQLNKCNEDYVDQQRKFESLKAQKTVTLDSDRKQQIKTLTRDAIDRVLVKRPPKEEEANKVTTVDVRFLPGKETTGSDLHIGGEGAGSRDAKFTVQLNQKMGALANQAAKYWGLDPEKVFFLDRDGRIVPDNMLLRDVVLPPVVQTSDTSQLVTIAEEGNDVDTLVVAQQQDNYIVQGRNYTLTLVRATTVLDKEDLNKPKGEVWNDFTFDAEALARELEVTRKKRFDSDAENVAAESLEDIPSLYDLIHRGELKKAKKLADQRCRWLEFTFFVLGVVLFYGLILVPDPLAFRRLTAVGTNALFLLTTFKNQDMPNPGLIYLQDATRDTQIELWVKGPLARYLGFDTDHKNVSRDPMLPKRGLHVVGAAIASYIPTHPDYMLNFSDIRFCDANPSVPSNTSHDNCSTSNVSGNSSCTNSTTDHQNVTRRSLRQRPRRLQSSDGECYDPMLRLCPTDSAVKIIHQAQKVGDFVTPCLGPSEASSVDFIAGLADQDVITARGEAAQYVFTEMTVLNLTNYSVFMAQMEDFKFVNDGQRAKMLAVFVYSPTMEAFSFLTVVIERSLSGNFHAVTTVESLNLKARNPRSEAGYPLIFVFTTLCFLMQVRRILAWPKRWTFEENRAHFGVSTVIFFVVPVLIIIAYSLYRMRDVIDSNFFVGLSFMDCHSRYLLMSNIQLARLALHMVILIALNVLWIVYMLMHFPELSFVGEMVKKMRASVFYLVIFLMIGTWWVAMMFNAVYSPDVYDFRNVDSTVMSTFRFLMGGLHNSDVLENRSPIIFFWIFVATFFAFTLILFRLPLVMLLSFKKEKDLFQNYSYHSFWASERSQRADANNFNPCTMGFDFSSGKAVDPNQ